MQQNDFFTNLNYQVIETNKLGKLHRYESSGSIIDIAQYQILEYRRKFARRKDSKAHGLTPQSGGLMDLLFESEGHAKYAKNILQKATTLPIRKIAILYAHGCLGQNTITYLTNSPKYQSPLFDVRDWISSIEDVDAAYIHTCNSIAPKRGIVTPISGSEIKIHPKNVKFPVMYSRGYNSSSKLYFFDEMFNEPNTPLPNPTNTHMHFGYQIILPGRGEQIHLTPQLILNEQRKRLLN